jgi:hypothetical protein
MMEVDSNMSKKENLINFVTENINEYNYLHCEVFYITFNETGTRSYPVSKQYLINHLQNTLDENCIGDGGDGVVIEILS